MRLTLKLLLALTVAAVIILGIGSVLRMRRELDLFATDTRRDDEFIAQVLARAVGDAWKAGGEPAAEAIVRDTKLTAKHLRVRWVWLDGKAPAPAVSRAGIDHALAGGIVAEERSNSDGKELVTVAPVPLPDGGHGGLEVVEPMRDRDRYVNRTIRDSVLSTGILVLALTAAGLGIGLVFIGRPTRKLVQKARAVAAGDLGHPIIIRQHDELGDLALELNTMCD